MLLTLGLVACSSNPLESLNPFKKGEDESQRGTIGFVQGFLGGVAADEPRAALIGRDILSAGGTAADAAVAVSFALSVTLPSSASLGGGGLCVVHDAKAEKTETLDFQAGVPKRIPATATQPTAVPGNVRGLAALHAKYGRLPWAQLVSPAESMARFGNQVSRALARDLQSVSPAMLADPEMRKILSRGKGGGIIREGDFFKQLDLSAVLGRLRARGAGDFYTGPLARQLVNAVTEAGGSLSVEDLRGYVPRWGPTLKIRHIKSTTFHFPMAASPSGILAAQMMGMLLENDEWEDATPAERAHLMAETAARAFAGRERWLRQDGTSAVDPVSLVSGDRIENLVAEIQTRRRPTINAANVHPVETTASPAGTGFVVADREGSAVACALTLNNLFGAGRVAPGMGIILAALPGLRGRGPDSLAAVLLVNNVHNVFYYAAAGSGGAVAPSALVAVTTGALLGKVEEDLEMALAAKRVHHGGAPDLTYYEQGLGAAIVNDLARRGHRLKPIPAMGLVNAILCPAGVPQEGDMTCANRTDPRGFGLASGTE
ncbi:MAG: gamma-glutamyltransferase [Rhodospirillales bacterium]